MNQLQRMLSIQSNEARLVVILGAMLFANAFSLEMGDVVATSGFLSHVSASGLPIVWSLSMVCIVIGSTAQSLLIDRIERVKLIRLLALFFSILYVGLRLLFVFGWVDAVNYGLLTILNDQQWFFFPLAFWLLANDIFEMAQAKRLFPLLIAIGFIGQIGGSAAAAITASAGIVGRDLLLVNAAIFFGVYLLIRLGLRGVQRKPVQKSDINFKEAISEAREFLANVPAFRYMCLAYLGLSVGLTVTRYAFLSTARSTLITPQEIQTFYGIYRFILMSAILFTSTMLTSRLMRALELKNSFLVYPLILSATLIIMIIAPYLLVVTAGMILTWLSYYTINQTARKAFQSLVPSDRRGRVSLVLDNYLTAIGVILGSIIVVMIVALTGNLSAKNATLVGLLFGLIGAGIGVWAITQVIKVYDQSLLNWRVKKRQKRLSVLDKLDL
ncbi:MAG: hypothetical protein U0670_13390 [Anaerolineae bacterium]